MREGRPAHISFRQWLDEARDLMWIQCTVVEASVNILGVCSDSRIGTGVDTPTHCNCWCCNVGRSLWSSCRSKASFTRSSFIIFRDGGRVRPVNDYFSTYRDRREGRQIDRPSEGQQKHKDTSTDKHHGTRPFSWCLDRPVCLILLTIFFLLISCVDAYCTFFKLWRNVFAGDRTGKSNSYSYLTILLSWILWTHGDLPKDMLIFKILHNE